MWYNRSMDNLVIWSGWAIAIAMLVWKIYETTVRWRTIEVVTWLTYETDAIPRSIYIGAKNNRRRPVHIIEIGFVLPGGESVGYSEITERVDLWVHKGSLLCGTWFDFQTIKRKLIKSRRKGFRFIEGVFIRDEGGHLYTGQIPDIINKKIES